MRLTGVLVLGHGDDVSSHDLLDSEPPAPFVILKLDPTLTTRAKQTVVSYLSI